MTNPRVVRTMSDADKNECSHILGTASQETSNKSNLPKGPPILYPLARNQARVVKIISSNCINLSKTSEMPRQLHYYGKEIILEATKAFLLIVDS